MSNSDHGGRRGGIQLALPWMCTHCSASFAEDEVRCPRCRLLRPRDGWNDVTSNSDPWLGREFDRRYVATRRVGRGAAASVYEARTPHSHERCALKVIDLSIDPFRDDAERWAEQVRNEVGILARVRSPHVLKFYDVVEIPGPAIAIVTEYIDGESLQDLLDRSGAVVPDRALELVRQTAVGMSEVHRRGAVHRDLKPDNILLQSLHGREDFVHVIDFGIVRIGDDTLRDSGYIGTPLYSSPEQSRGHSIGPQSDIYSLGAVLFHLLTGRPPFEGRTAESLLAQHAFERAPNVARSDPKHEYAPQVIDLVASMLEKEPSARPASMGEVAERISRLSRQCASVGPAN